MFTRLFTIFCVSKNLFIMLIYLSSWITAFIFLQISGKYNFIEEPIEHLVASFFWWITIWRVYD